MKVQGLRVGKGKINSITVELEDGSTLELDPEIVVKYQIKAGLDLDETFCATLRQEQAKLAARRRLVHYLSPRKKTKQEARLYLLRLGFGEEVVDYAISAACELGLLDDSAYAEAFVRTQKRVAKKGPRAIAHELIAKGVEPSAVQQSVASNYSSDQQRALARQVAQKRMASLGSKIAGSKLGQRLYAFLLNRGFEPEVCAEVVRELVGDSYE
ncbi:MAG: recombination regulator RecX [Candidatus Sumerlaeaceae bacterium]|nr:recombination regulator RecX [Candidatus Sumerlaeaceae bacterium]